MHVASYIFCFDQIFAFAWYLKRIYIFFVAAGRAERCPAPLLLVGDHSSPPLYIHTNETSHPHTSCPTDPRFS